MGLSKEQRQLLVTQVTQKRVTEKETSAVDALVNVLGKVAVQGHQGPPGRDGKDGIDGNPGKDGVDGRDGVDGKDGQAGPMPKHEIKGKRFRFENPDGSWGKWGLAGGSSIYGVGGGGGGSNLFTEEQATDLTDGGDSTLHYHASDRDRANHTGTQTASTISDFDTEVSNNTDVAANTTHRTSDGSDHTFINQSVTTSASPTFAGVTSTGAVAVDDTTDSTSTATGSLQTDGGLGVAKTGYFGTGINVTGRVTSAPSSDSGTAFSLATNDGLRDMWVAAPANGDSNAPFIFNTGNSYDFQTDNTSKFRIGSNGNIVFNHGAGDADFTIKKNTSGNAYNYNAGTDAHNFSGAITSSSAIAVDDTTDSTSTTTGSLQTDGGLGVAKDANLGGNVEVHGTQVLVSGSSPSVYVGGVTNSGDDGLRMHQASSSTFIDHKGSGNMVFRADDFTGAVTRMTIDSSSGAVTIAGNLSKGSGSFKIDHPLPEMEDTHHLYHSFIEGPRADNIYRGVVNLVAGTATINLDVVSCMTEGTFVALNKNVQAFTTNEQTWDNVRGSVSGNILTIECQDPESAIEISWLVIGERKDKIILLAPWIDEDGSNCIEQPK